MGGREGEGCRMSNIESVRWIACAGCDGEVGIPGSWSEPTALCPKCGTQVTVATVSSILWRPSAKPDGAISQPAEMSQQASGLPTKARETPMGVAYPGVEWM